MGVAYAASGCLRLVPPNFTRSSLVVGPLNCVIRKLRHDVGLGSGLPGESDEEKRKRLAAIATSQGRLTRSLSPAGLALFGFGSAGT